MSPGAAIPATAAEPATPPERAHQIRSAFRAMAGSVAIGDVECGGQALRDTPAAELAARRAELQAAAQAAGMTVTEIDDVINSRPDLPRPLLAEERATLVAVLAHADFRGRDALLDQVETAHVDGLCGCGCATVFLTVDRELPPATGTDGRA